MEFSLSIKQCQMNKMLLYLGRLGEAGAVLAANGDVRGAVRVWLRGGRARRAATALLHHPALLRDDEMLHAVHDQLVQVLLSILLLLSSER